MTERMTDDVANQVPNAMRHKTGNGRRPVTFPSLTNPKRTVGWKNIGRRLPCICEQDL